jgi:hypothetical protein
VNINMRGRKIPLLKAIGSIERFENPKVSLATWREIIETFELWNNGPGRPGGAIPLGDPAQFFLLLTQAIASSVMSWPKW